MFWTSSIVSDLRTIPLEITGWTKPTHLDKLSIIAIGANRLLLAVSRRMLQLG